MTFNIKFSDEALLDLYEARSYYGKLSNTLLVKFDTVFNSAIERLALNPENFQKRYKEIKIVFTKIFPYGIHYIINNQTAYIQRVLHQKQYFR